jgi:transcriptional regulator with XRE-family HTH domain
MGQPAAEVLGLAEAMGLLPPEAVRGSLDRESFLAAADYIAKAGIGTELIAELRASFDSDQVGRLLRQLAVVLRENPAPDQEWRRLQEIFSTEQLAALLGISATSVARYRAHERKTPDQVAARLHLLARIVHHLEGIYNEFGVRRWFWRPRKVLNERAPADVLHGAWDPDSSGPMHVLEMARSGNRSAAT